MPWGYYPKKPESQSSFYGSYPTFLGATKAEESIFHIHSHNKQCLNQRLAITLQENWFTAAVQLSAPHPGLVRNAWGKVNLRDLLLGRLELSSLNQSTCIITTSVLWKICVSSSTLPIMLASRITVPPSLTVWFKYTCKKTHGIVKRQACEFGSYPKKPPIMKNVTTMGKRAPDFQLTSILMSATWHDSFVNWELSIGDQVVWSK